MSSYMEATTAVTDASGHVRGHTDVIADNGQVIKRARLNWEKDAPNASLHVLQSTDSVDPANAADDASTSAVQSTIEDSGMGLVQRVIYRLEQAPEGPDFRAFLAGAAKRYSVPVENLTATTLEGNAIDLSTQIDGFEEHFFVNVTQADGEVKQWEFWFEPPRNDDDAGEQESESQKISGKKRRRGGRA